ncbi:alpha/beta fold hydrolase [Alkalilimnicola ehrlichii]|nr:alpha/beta fold hydrolase [Alkalilimnicola ehrlichii]
MLPGWGMSAVVWRDWAEALAGEWCVHLFELPGHAGDPAEDFDVATLRAQLIESAPAGAVWVGWSLGGMLSLQLAHETAAAGMCLMATSPRFCTGDGWSAGVDPAALRAMQAGLEQGVERVWREFLGLLGSRGGTARAEVKALRYRQPTPAAGATGLQAGLRYLLTTDLRSMVARIETPTRWLVGELDPLISPAAVEGVASSMVAAKATCLLGAGHVPFYSHRAELDAALAELRRML